MALVLAILSLIPVSRVLWFVWANFHPQTEVVS